MKKTTAERLRELMDMRGLKQADIVRLCQPYADRLGVKLQKSALSQYISGRNEPNQYKLTVLALALNVSEPWLMGYDVPMYRVDTTPTNAAELTSTERIMLESFRRIPDKQQKILIQMIRDGLSNL
jgi:transcriptional regulator with XRE-family HTH domain